MVEDPQIAQDVAFALAETLPDRYCSSARSSKNDRMTGVVSPIGHSAARPMSILCGPASKQQNRARFFHDKRQDNLVFL
jgi:hypothetical protein